MLPTQKRIQFSFLETPFWQADMQQELIKSNLIVKSSQDEEQKFNMDEVEESIAQTYDSKKARKINAMMNTNLEIEE